jgi:hypothetical protein
LEPINPVNGAIMRNFKDESGPREFIFLSQEDKELLIYTTSDIWITPELKRFKKEILDRAGTGPLG